MLTGQCLEWWGLRCRIPGHWRWPLVCWRCPCCGGCPPAAPPACLRVRDWLSRYWDTCTCWRGTLARSSTPGDVGKTLQSSVNHFPCPYDVIERHWRQWRGVFRFDLMASWDFTDIIGEVFSICPYDIIGRHWRQWRGVFDLFLWHHRTSFTRCFRFALRTSWDVIDVIHEVFSTCLWGEGLCGRKFCSKFDFSSKLILTGWK